MKKIRGILSIILVLTLLCSSFTFMGTVSAANVNTAETSATPDNVQDGLILHAFCWGYSEIEANLDAIASAGYTAIQTSPVQQPKDMNASTDISGQWWKLYQPASLSIGDNTWLGTKAELTSLCAAAEKKGLKIICDVVTNHLGASSEDGTYKFADEVKTYEPTLWNATNGALQNNPYFHQVFGNTSDSSVQSITQGWLSACPDLNTGHQYIQDSVCDLLKECIDCGVDGFRFDAAKHIETPDDGEYASDYWPTVIGYAKSLNPNIFVYGEILNSTGAGRSYASYTDEGLSITDNKASAQIRAGVTGHNAPGAAVADYNVGNASDAVLWAESHDTYLGKDDSTVAVSNEDIVKTWAIVASRKDATALFFPRTDSMSMGGTPVDTTYKSVAVTEINKFHNECVGQSETLGSNGNFAYVVRGQKGIVIVNTNGTTASASISGTGLANGEYTDMITGNKFTVSNGTVSGNIGSTGVAVVTKGTTTPTVFSSQETQEFEGDTITMQLTLNNATSGTYQLDNYDPIEFTGSPVIRIGSDYKVGDTITLTLTATDGTQTTTTTYKYTKKQGATSGVYVMVPGSLIQERKWTAPLYCYIYDEVTDASSNKVYQNAAWPGEPMLYDEALGCYYVQVQNNSCLQSIKGSTATPVASNFNLATSANTNVIVSDSAASNGATSSGNQYPRDGAAFKLPLGGTTHKLTNMSVIKPGWEVSTEVPGKSTVAATEVTKDGTSVKTYTIGDANLDETVDINDVTAIQKFLVKSGTLACDLAVADVDKNNKINIFDATYIQRHLVGMSNDAFVGEKTEATGGSTTPTTPTNPTNPTQPSTPAVETYLIYVKTAMTWIEDMGSSLFAYDKATGESYYMVRDTDVTSTNVFVSEVPKTCKNVMFYRATSVVDNPATSDVAYNKFEVTFTETNNCYTWSSWSDSTGSASGTVGPYTPVDDSTPTDGLKRLYVDNSEANWSEIYVYGWGNGLVNTQTYPLTHLTGSIWYIDLPQAIPNGTESFLLKNSSEPNTWNLQSANVTVNLPNNCYKLSSTNAAPGSWYTYN